MFGNVMNDQDKPLWHRIYSWVAGNVCLAGVVILVITYTGESSGFVMKEKQPIYMLVAFSLICRVCTALPKGETRFESVMTLMLAVNTLLMWCLDGNRNIDHGSFVIVSSFIVAILGGIANVIYSFKKNNGR